MRLDDPRLAALAGETPAGCPRSCRSSRSRPTTGCSSPRRCSRTASSATSTARSTCRRTACSTSGASSRRATCSARCRRGSGVGVGLAVCEDFWHLSTPQLLALDGAQILINVSSSPGRDLARDQRGGPRDGDLVADADAHLRPAHDVVRRVRATGSGVDESISFWGGSEVIAPTGAPVFSAPLFDEGLFCVDIDLADVRRERIALPLLRDERPELVARELARLVARAGGARARTRRRSRAPTDGLRRGGRTGERGAGRRPCSSCPTSSRSTPASRAGSSPSSSAASCARRASSGRCWACRAASTRRSSRTSSPRRSAPSGCCAC